MRSGRFSVISVTCGRLVDEDEAHGRQRPGRARLRATGGSEEAESVAVDDLGPGRLPVGRVEKASVLDPPKYLAMCRAIPMYAGSGSSASSS